MKRRLIPLSIAVLVLAAGAYTLQRRPDVDATAAPSVYFDTELVRNQLDLSRQRKRSRKWGLVEHTERPGAIDWAPTIDAAIERASAEDKPIFVFQFVRENGDPACDV